MISPIDPLAGFQQHQMERKMQALVLEKEQFVRLTILLANLLKTPGASVAIVDGHVAIKRADFDAVPKHYVVNAAEGAMNDATKPDDPPVKLIVVQVAKKPDTNGVVVARDVPPTPRILIP